jgi:hypothetical protein
MGEELETIYYISGRGVERKDFADKLGCGVGIERWMSWTVNKKREG